MFCTCCLCEIVLLLSLEGFRNPRVITVLLVKNIVQRLAISSVTFLVAGSRGFGRKKMSFITRKSARRSKRCDVFRTTFCTPGVPTVRLAMNIVQWLVIRSISILVTATRAFSRGKMSWTTRKSAARSKHDDVTQELIQCVRQSTICSPSLQQVSNDTTFNEASRTATDTGGARPPRSRSLRLLSLSLSNFSRPALILRDQAVEVPYVMVRREQVLMYWKECMRVLQEHILAWEKEQD